MFSILNHFLNKIFSNLIGELINILKYLEPIYPLSSPLPKFNDLGRLEALDKGFYGKYNCKILALKQKWKKIKFLKWILHNLSIDDYSKMRN